MKDAANVSANEAQQYQFVLDNAIETVDSATEDHRKLLEEQDDLAKHKKLIKDASKGTGVSPE